MKDIPNPIPKDGPHRDMIGVARPLSIGQLTVDDEPVFRPHHESYFIGGKVAKQQVKFLVDTGCTTNLLSKVVFDRLPVSVKGKLQQTEEDYGLTADEAH